MLTKFAISVLFVFVAAVSFGQSGTAASDEHAIRKADEDWSRSAKLSSIDKFVTFYADRLGTSL